MSADFDVTEKRFEEDIESYLCSHGGYSKGNPKAFDRKYALDIKTLLSFVQTTQPNKWKRYVTMYQEQSEEQFIKRFCDSVNKADKGLLDILRKGFVDRGVTFHVVKWRPETSLNEDAAEAYKNNILHCTRQLYYSLSNKNSVDMVLFLNGIPLISLELKGKFTGQDVSNAITQYTFTRSGSDPIFEFKKRVLVHFAVDFDDIYMTTRLRGKDTYFLPFNQGSNGAGNVGGKGNPVNKDGYNTSYLWEKVLHKDQLLEILQKYIHLESQTTENEATGRKTTKETMIFPRYHQLDVVTKLLTDVKTHGAGGNYLIQHSAGSGKSNSIAWLAHRLAGLHMDGNQKIFQSTIVVTDRKVLDQQLQNTISQFDHTQGVIQNIDKDSKQLKDAINNGVPIIITTLQKFPVIYKEIEKSNKKFAIIVDEAHSSQTGEAAKKLKASLGNTEAVLEEYARMENAFEEQQVDPQDRILQELAAQGQQENLSFFAFTATPKAKTLQMFGEKQKDGTYRAFHIYSMRQAIEEGFILDVLRNYMTYTTYYKIIKHIAENPELDTSAGVKAIKKYKSLHPHNISQKADVILEHFYNNTRYNIGGRAKAMLVTGSRLHAVRYYCEMQRQIKQKGYNNVGILVAFSGEVDDEMFPIKKGESKKVTEEKLNKNKKGQTIKETQLKEYFSGDDFNMLVVAEKYQTGFDEPCLHTMFVDKKLTGVKAVQTLSRLNRIMKGKDSTFVLDFVNTAEEMKKSFEPFYEATVLDEETDPNVIYDLQRKLDDFNVYKESEVKEFGKRFFNDDIQGDKDLGKLNSILSPVLDRFRHLANDEEKDRFKTILQRFLRIYSFITQVFRLFDRDIHEYSLFLRFFNKIIQRDSGDKKIPPDLKNKISLEFYRLEKTANTSITLEGTEIGAKAITGETSSRKEEKTPLEEIILTINQRFGTEFEERDKVIIQQIISDFQTDTNVVNFAKDNSLDNFSLLYEKSFYEKVVDRHDRNSRFFGRLFSDSEFMNIVKDSLKEQIYKALRNSAA